MKQLIIVFLVFSQYFYNASLAADITPNQFKKGSDSDRIEAAIKQALKTGDNSIVIPRYDKVNDKTLWLIDRVILLPSDFTLILKDCLIRLAPGTQDNIITNSGARTNPLTENKNISIIGQGNVVLCGGLESHFNPPGDPGGYKTIGILLYNTKYFKIEGLKMEETQAWAISLENGCAYGRISNIDFANTGKIPNQDGIDLRKGCHDIIIENITGTTGDDMIALTGLRNLDVDWKMEISEGNAKGWKRMQVGGYGYREDDNIYNITINNVKGTIAGKQIAGLIRLTNHDGVKIYNIFINDVMDTSEEGKGLTDQAILIGDFRYWKHHKNQLGDTYRIFIDNVISNSPTAIRIIGTLKDSRITNVVGCGQPRGKDHYAYGADALVHYFKGVKLENVKVEATQY